MARPRAAATCASRGARRRSACWRRCTGGGCDPALISRFYVVFPTLGTFTNKPLNDLMQHDRNPTDVDKAGFASMQSWARNTQKMLYWTLRMIHIRAIPDVDLGAVNMVIDRFSRAWGTGSNPRAFERVILQCRVCCIMTAMHMHYSAPGAPRAGEVPCAEHVPEMVPNMVCTAEQAKFCLALMSSEFTNPCERAVMQAVAKCNLTPDMDSGGADYLVPANVDCTAAWVREVLMHCRSQAVTAACRSAL